MLADTWTLSPLPEGFITFKPPVFDDGYPAEPYDLSKGSGSELWVQYNQRFAGLFFTPLDLHQFPYDYQFAQIIMDSSSWGASMSYTGGFSVKFFPTTDVADYVEQMIPAGFTVQEWDIQTPRGNVQYTDREYPAYGVGVTYSWLKATVNLGRQPEFYLYKIVAGVILVVYMCLFIYSIEVQETDRMMGTISCFLALVSFTFVAGQSLPKVAYQTRIDKFMDFSFLIIFLVYLTHAAMFPYRPDEDAEEAPAKEGEKKEGEKKEEAHEMNVFNLPHFSDLPYQRRGDLIFLILFFIIYNAGIAGILLPATTKPVPIASAN